MENQNIEKELFFQITVENNKREKNIKTKKILKVALENMRKMAIDRLMKKAGEC